MAKKSRAARWLEISPPLRTALKRRKPVVALETAVLTHGLPPTERLPMAQQLEATIRSAGAVPAFIALLDGQARVGLSGRKLKRLAEDKTAVKCSRADLGWLFAKKFSAGTTVSATLYLAAQAGLEVAATGGIGGVHRDAAGTFDVSADLAELTRAPLALVCSGAKSIVDSRRTLEALESQSVPVVGFQTAEFPGFLVRETGSALRAMARDIAELAAAIRAYRDTGYSGAILVANPIPPGAALPAAQVEFLVQQAHQRAAQQGVAGAALTPFLLETMNRMSEGATLRANKALLVSNARVAAYLAVELARPAAKRRSARRR